MFTAILLSASLVSADPKPLELSELVSIALEHNPDTKIAWWHAKRAASSVSAAKSAYFPKLDLGLTAASGQEYEFINGPNKKFTQTSADMALTYMLFDFGERSNEVRARKMALEAANWQRDFTLQKVVVKTLELAYNVLHAQEALQAAKITKDDAQKMCHAAEALADAGFSPISDVYTSKALAAEAEMNLARWSKELDISKGMLAKEVGLEADTRFELAPIHTVKTPPKEQVDVLIARAKIHRKDLLAQAARLKESEAYLQKSYASYLPKLSTTVSGGINHYHNDHTKHGNYQAALTLNVPLFSGFSSIYESRMAYADNRTSLEELHKLELAIGQEVLAAHRTLEACQDMFALASVRLDNALLAYEGALEKYKAGKEGMFQDVSSALRTLAEARVRYSEVRTEWLLSLARLAYATGTIEGL